MEMIGVGGRSLYYSVKDLDAVGIYDVIPGGRMFLSGLQMNATWVSPGEADAGVVWFSNGYA
jgi:hypothetical protein